MRNVTMKVSNVHPAGCSAADPGGDSLVGRVLNHSREALVETSDMPAQDLLSPNTPQGLQVFAQAPPPRVAIKSKGKILFINLAEVISVRAKGKYVWLRRNASSYLLRESISVVAERLQAHGFIRIHRSVLVNASLAEELRLLSTGEYCLRLEGGNEFTVTRTYRRNLKSLAAFWIGAGAFPS